MRSKLLGTLVLSAIFLGGCAPNGATPTPKYTVVVSQLDTGATFTHVGFIEPLMDMSTFSANVYLEEVSDASNICRNDGPLAMTEPNIGTGVVTCPSIGMRTDIRVTPYPSNDGSATGVITNAAGERIGTYRMGWGEPAESLRPRS